MNPIARVALFPSAFHPSLGGIEETTRQLAHQLRERGRTPTIITMRWPLDLAPAEEFEGLPVRRVRFVTPTDSVRSMIRLGFRYPTARAEVLRHVRDSRPDVIHVQGVSSNGHFAHLASRSAGVPLVITLQGELTMDSSRIYERSPTLRKTLRRLLVEADAVTACSAHTLAEAEEFLGDSLGDRGTVIPNGTEIGVFADASPFVHSRPYIAALGRFVHEKGFDLLLRSVALLGERGREIDLVVAGSGEQESALRALAAELEIEDRVCFFGRADRTEVASILKGAELFVLPSRHEPFGIVNVEAMAAGIPVVAAAVGGVPDLLDEESNGLTFPAEDVDAMTRAIEEVLDSPTIRDRLVAAGLSCAASHDWREIADRYEAIYEKVLATGVRP